MRCGAVRKYSTLMATLGPTGGVKSALLVELRAKKFACVNSSWFGLRIESCDLYHLCFDIRNICFGGFVFVLALQVCDEQCGDGADGSRQGHREDEVIRRALS